MLDYLLEGGKKNATKQESKSYKVNTRSCNTLNHSAMNISI